MTNDQVRLSRLASQVVDLLNRETRIDFTEVVMGSVSVDDVPQPYRNWLLDPSKIPAEKRRRGLGDPPSDE
jgi:hypothetical protein